MDSVNTTDSAFGGTGTSTRDGRHEDATSPVNVNATEHHEDVFSSVYVNAAGHSTLVSEKVTGFPEGSVIVREKLIGPINPTPELLTVMVKRGKGFNPAGGDWEYMVLNGAGTTIRERGNLASCNSCHARQKESDFVFRTYLPMQVRLKQR